MDPKKLRKLRSEIDKNLKAAGLGHIVKILKAHRKEDLAVAGTDEEPDPPSRGACLARYDSQSSCDGVSIQFSELRFMVCSKCRHRLLEWHKPRHNFHWDTCTGNDRLSLQFAPLK